MIAHIALAAVDYALIGMLAGTAIAGAVCISIEGHIRFRRARARRLIAAAERLTRDAAARR